ncbi:MAG: ribbon-helix-helix protein, CopG family [Gemmatimonadaceae bacterium]
MKSEALTLRISADLAKNLRKLAKQKGLPTSQVVREAVAKYLSPRVEDSRLRQVTARALAVSWKTLPRLTPEEAAELEREITEARDDFILPQSPWE